MLYYVRIHSDFDTIAIKGPYLSLRIAKYVAYHLRPNPSYITVTISIIDRNGKCVSSHIEKWR